MVDAKNEGENPNSGPPSSEDGGRVDSIGVHPVKSLAGLRPDRWWFGPLGPSLDRRWMLIDQSGRFLSLRELPGLACLRPSFCGPNGQEAGSGPLSEDQLPSVRLNAGQDQIEFRTHPTLGYLPRSTLESGSDDRGRG